MTGKLSLTYKKIMLPDYLSDGWKNIINLQKNNFNCPQSFFDSVNDLLTIHATYKIFKNINLNSKYNYGLVLVYKNLFQ